MTERDEALERARDSYPPDEDGEALAHVTFTGTNGSDVTLDAETFFQDLAVNYREVAEGVHKQYVATTEAAVLSVRRLIAAYARAECAREFRKVADEWDTAAVDDYPPDVDPDWLRARATELEEPSE